ncbi:alpha/beta hydrolase family protein [Nocardia sp. NPDC051052]|uniref:alpha/beta hydrolase family protein n=1 Tax=Nocardia sp. NPDC051052 TaxID=3364322 RepID=UPI0037BC5935
MSPLAYWLAVVALVLSIGWVSASPVHAQETGVSTTDVSFTGSDGVVLNGTVTVPMSAHTPSAAIVLLGGSDWHVRADLRKHAEMFAQLGLVTLTFDKRTVGYSKTHRNYGLLADDAAAAVELLRARPEVDPARVGLWGVSEGAWVAPLAASRSDHVGFVITVGGVGMGGARQTAWYQENLIRHQGVSGSMPKTFAHNTTRIIVAAGLFPEADYDPVPVLERIRQPLLALWGEYDINHPPQESSRVFTEALARGGNQHYAIEFVPGGGPDLDTTSDAGFDALEPLAPRYPELVGAWLTGLANRQPDVVVESAPAQDRQSEPLLPLAWYESLWAQGFALALFLVAFLTYPLTGLIRRIRGRNSSSPVRHQARWLVVTAPLVVVGFLAYLALLQSTGMRHLGPLVLARPIPWLVLQLLTLGAALATLTTAVSWWRHRREIVGADRVRLLLLLAAGLVFLPWAVFWGLLLP